MSLVTLNEILPQARAEKRAVGAFNVTNFESAVAVITAAERENRPVILATYQRLLSDPKISALIALLRKLGEESPVQVAVHLDHGASVDQIDIGYTSVMLDGSHLPLKENIELTIQGVVLAKKAGLSIEGEVGHIPAGNKEPVPYADPDEAVLFANETGVDVLAVGIGTAHGFYVNKPVLNLAIAEEVGRCLSIPMVLHGGSDTPRDKVLEAVRYGMAKVNVATEVQFLYEQELKKKLNDLGEKFIPIDVLMKPIIEVTSAHVSEIIRHLAQTE